MCKQCSKQFLYVASLKKHLQNLHPETFEKLNSDHSLEQYCTVIQSPIQKETSPEPKGGEVKKPTNGNKKQEIQEEKEEVKQVQPTFPAAKEELGEEPNRLQNAMGAIMGQYYNPQLQSDVFSMAYGNPFLYAQPNYGLLCMLQAAKQNDTLRQSASSDFWMQKLASNPAPALPNDPLISAPVNYPINPEPNPLDHAECKQEMGGISAIMMEKIDTLPTTLSKTLAQGEHHHIHCEFCGHSTIRHNGHIDHVHDAELHHVGPSGIEWIRNE